MVASTPLAHYSWASHHKDFLPSHPIDTPTKNLMAIQIENEMLKRRKRLLLPLQSDAFMSTI
jgi:hypothetical protein